MNGIDGDFSAMDTDVDGALHTLDEVTVLVEALNEGRNDETKAIGMKEF